MYDIEVEVVLSNQTANKDRSWMEPRRNFREEGKPTIDCATAVVAVFNIRELELPRPPLWLHWKQAIWTILRELDDPQQ